MLSITCTIRQHFLPVYINQIYIFRCLPITLFCIPVHMPVYIILYNYVSLYCMLYILIIIIHDYDIYTQIILNLDVMVMVLYEWRGGGLFQTPGGKSEPLLHTLSWIQEGELGFWFSVIINWYGPASLFSIIVNFECSMLACTQLNEN